MVKLRGLPHDFAHLAIENAHIIVSSVVNFMSRIKNQQVLPEKQTHR
jgi:hypothetical protein